MRVCMIGKFPPIEGGVSMHQYWYAHALAARGHQVHVVTNAREVELRFRMFMRSEDWLRCEADYPGGGSVRVHWTEAADHRQRHIPWHNAFLTKLVSLASEVVRSHDLQLVFSYYLEPYGIAGHLTAEMTKRPHVVKHAGSDIGRLRLHPQLGPLYDHVLRAADRVITGGSVARQLVAMGLEERRCFQGDDFRVPESLFHPEGGQLDLPALIDAVSGDPEFGPAYRGGPLPNPPFIGTYGKLGEAKGTFDLLRAIRRLRDDGRRLSLLVVGHGWGRREAQFHDAVAELNLDDCVYQLPFLPHWRIPEFIRLCLAVCFLERDFPIAFHAPTIPREILACGGCLVASAEILERQLFAERLVSGFNCVAIRRVQDVEDLTATLASVLDDPEGARMVGARGRQYSAEAEALRSFPLNYETLFAEVLDDRGGGRCLGAGAAPRPTEDFSWTHLAIETLPEALRTEVAGAVASYGTGRAWALGVYGALLALVDAGRLERSPLLDGIRLELYLAGLLGGQDLAAVDARGDGLFRLRVKGGFVRDADVSSLYPLLVPGVEIEEYPYDVGELLAARERRESPLWVAKRPSYAAILPDPRRTRGRVFALRGTSALLLGLCDGRHTVGQLAGKVASELGMTPDSEEKVVSAVAEYFRLGLVSLLREPLAE